jgi:hypothetical protein
VHTSIVKDIINYVIITMSKVLEGSMLCYEQVKCVVIVCCTRVACKSLTCFLYSFIRGDVDLVSALAPDV